MFKKLFGGSKNDFYLEIKEDNSSTPSQPPATANGAKSAAKPVVTEAPKAAAPAAEASESAETTTKETTRQKTFRKPTGGQKEAVSAKPVTPAPAPVAAVKATPKLPEIKTFAPTYLMPTSTNDRRRPGPNMNAFLDMARQVKTPPKFTK